MKLNIGCGSRHKDGYINIDIANMGADVIADSVDLPFGPSSINVIESYHLIEHMDRRKAKKALLHWYTLLKNGGVLVIECPDLEEVCKEYLKGNIEMLFSIYGRNRQPYDTHLWGYSKTSISELLRLAGFRTIKTSLGRDYHALLEPCLRVEAVK